MALLDLEVARSRAREESSRLAAEEQARQARAARERATALALRLASTRARVALVLEALYRAPPRQGIAALIAGDAAAADSGASLLARRQLEMARELDESRRASRRAEQEATGRARSAELLAGEARLRATQARSARADRERRLRAISSDRTRARELEEELARAEAGLLGGLTRPVEALPSSPDRSPPRPRADLAGLDGRRGRLPWPLADRGRIGGGFGDIVNPRHGTRTLRHGLILEAPEGTPIRAVAEGRALFVDWFKGFGRCLVIDHGGGWLSVQAHARSFSVSQGDDVVAGQVVGEVGDTGSLEGPRLYFQLSRDGEPLDPLDWLER